MFGLVVALVVLGTTIWVGFDSATNQVSTSSKNPYTPNTGAVAWVLGCILLWIVVFPFYLYRRSQTLRQNVAGGMSSMPGVPRTAIGPFCRSCGQHVLPEATLCPSCGAATGPPSIQPSTVDGAPPAQALTLTPRPQPSATRAPPQTAQPQPLAPRPGAGRGTGGKMSTNKWGVRIALMVVALVAIAAVTAFIMHGYARSAGVAVGPKASAETVAFIDAAMPKLETIMKKWDEGDVAGARRLWTTIGTVLYFNQTDKTLSEDYLAYANNVRYYTVGDGSATLKDVEDSRAKAEATLAALRP